MTLESRVKKGAALMDQKVPQWYNKINIDRLDMNDFRQCVLGQCFPSMKYFSEIWPELGIEDDEMDEELGFSLPDIHSNSEVKNQYGELTREWVNQIVRRREAASDFLVVEGLRPKEDLC